MKPDTTLTLGDFTFEGLEIPESITAGGAQQLVTHQLVGGARVIDAMGRGDRDLEWSGYLMGPAALERARYLDTLRVNAPALLLSWSKLRFTVVIAEFEWTFERWYHLQYKIRCTVIEDLNAPVKRVVTNEELNQAIAEDLEKAKELGAEVDDSILSSALNSIDTAIKAVSDFATATQETIDAVLTPIVAAQQRVETLIAGANNFVQNVTTLGGILPNNPISQAVTKISGQAANYLQLGNLYTLQSTLGRLDVGLSQVAGLGTTVQSLKVAGGDLFTVAKDLYGDARKWTGLAEANGITDPVLTGVTELKVPEKVPDSGGVLGSS